MRCGRCCAIMRAWGVFGKMRFQSHERGTADATGRQGELVTLGEWRPRLQDERAGSSDEDWSGEGSDKWRVGAG